jgi:hypothetical protein
MLGIDLSVALGAGMYPQERDLDARIPENPLADPGWSPPPDFALHDPKNPRSRTVNRARLLEMVDQVEDMMELLWSHPPPPGPGAYGAGGFGGPQGVQLMSRLLQLMHENGMGPLKLYG